MRRLQPRKNMPKTTVRDRTHMTAIWTTLMMKRLLSSGAAATKPLSVTTEEKLQQKNSAVLLSKPPSVWFKPVVFISTFPSSETFSRKDKRGACEEPRREEDRGGRWRCWGGEVNKSRQIAAGVQQAAFGIASLEPSGVSRAASRDEWLHQRPARRTDGTCLRSTAGESKIKGGRHQAAGLIHTSRLMVDRSGFLPIKTCSIKSPSWAYFSYKCPAEKKCLNM